MIEEVELVAEGLAVDKSTWAKVKFGNVAIQQKENVDRDNTDLTRYVAGEHMGSEDLHIRTWGEVNDDYLGPAFHRKFEDGDILYGSRRTYLRKVAVAHFDGITANTTFVIKPNEDLIIKELLPFVMLSESFTQYSIRNSKGSVNPYINWKDIASYEFLLPPKDQQWQIAELLWAGKEMLEKGLFVQKELITMCETFIHTFFKNKICEYEKLGQVAEIRYGLTLNSKRGQLPISAPYLRVANVSRGEISLNEVKEVGCTEDELKNYQLIENDIVIVEGHADKQEIGRAAIWNKGSKVMLHQNHLIRVRCNNEKVLPEVIEAYINSAFGQVYFHSNSKSTSGLNTINSTVVKECKVPLIELELQDDFVQKKSVFSNQIKALGRHIINSKALQKTLINQFF